MALLDGRRRRRRADAIGAARRATRDVRRLMAAVRSIPTAPLAEAQERQPLLLASLPRTLVALYDRDLRCQMLDGQMVRQTGLDPAEYVGRPISQTLPPEQYETLAPLILNALNGHSSRVEWASTLSAITYELDVVPYRSSDGTIAGAFAVCRDLTERLAGGAELREREQQLAQAQAVAHLGSWELDTAGDRLIWSDELCRIAGQPPGSTPTVAEFLSMVHPDDLPLLSAEVDDAIDGHASRSEYRIVRPDGTLRHVLTTRDPRVDADGNVIRLFGTTQDITERVQDERRMRQLAAVVRHSGEAITARDADGNISEWNAGAQRLYGYTAEEMIGGSLKRMIPPERAGEDEELLERALAGETIEQFQTERLHRDGSRLEVSITVSPIRDHQGKPVGASIISRDVTASHQADRARRQALAKMAEAQRIARIGSWSWDTAEDSATWSAEMYRLFGRDPMLGPATGEQLFAYVHPHDRERVIAGYLETFGGGPAFEVDYRISAGDGVERVLNARGRLERPGYYVGTVQDVTGLRATEREARESAKLFRETIEHAPIGIALVAPDGRWLSANRALCQIVGYSEEELLALTFQDITHPEDLDADLELRDRILDGELPGYRLEKRYFHKSGRVIHAQLSVTLVRDEHGQPAHFITQIQDETAIREARAQEAETKQQLDEALERFQVAFERAPIGMVIIGLDGIFQRVNESLCEMTGYTPEQFRAMAPFVVVDPYDRRRIQGEFARLGVETDVLAFEHRITHADGHPVWIQSRVTLIRDEGGRPVHALAQVLDLTERRAYEERLKQLADHDSLTGLLNRRGFGATLDTHIARCRRYGATGALLALDLDGFKLVNDTLGHGAGDDLLVSCAQALRSRLRETDTVARLGGDEFAVLLSDQSIEEAEVVARALVETIRQCAAQIPRTYPGRVSGSIGVAAFPDPVCSADEILTAADRAMYEAKQRGRDGHAVYGADLASAKRAGTPRRS
jgi:diguanylate cyclase (GGDEF)-like protein/PAS domain S-box-containing protein